MLGLLVGEDAGVCESVVLFEKVIETVGERVAVSEGVPDVDSVIEDV